MSDPVAQPLSLFELIENDEPRTPQAARRSTPPRSAAVPHPTPITQLPPLLTMIEAAALLRIGRTTIYKLAEVWRATDSAEGLPTVRIGTKLFVRRADLERIISGPDEAA